jgi:hypothetical protein
MNRKMYTKWHIFFLDASLYRLRKTVKYLSIVDVPGEILAEYHAVTSYKWYYLDVLLGLWLHIEQFS